MVTFCKDTEFGQRLTGVALQEGECAGVVQEGETDRRACPRARTMRDAEKAQHAVPLAGQDDEGKQCAVLIPLPSLLQGKGNTGCAGFRRQKMHTEVCAPSGPGAPALAGNNRERRL